MPAIIENTLSVKSVAFSHGGHIPPKYTCEGEDINPPLEIANFPNETKSLAIIVEDPDAPGGIFDHWLVWNIPTNEPIGENSIPGISGSNSFGKIGYGGPCPPSGTHRYFFKIFALDTSLDLEGGANKTALQKAMKGHVIASGEIMGLYKRSR